MEFRIAPSTPLHRTRNDADERALLASVARSNRQAFETLYLAYHRRLTRFVMRLAPRYEIAEEVINDTFWIVWQKAGDFRGGSQVSTWIMGIAYRRVLKALRNAKEHDLPTSTAPTAEAEQLTTPDPNDEAVVRAWVHSALSQLPREQRIAIELAYYCGHSCEEIGAIMQCPVSTVKARLFHARQRLKQLLPAMAGEFPDEPSK